MIKINIGGFITVRLGSTRLPKKSLLKIKGKPTIVHLIDRIKQTKNLNKIVLCTTTNPEDEALLKIADEESINSYAGHEKNILIRHYDAAIHYDIDFIINIDGDDLFCDPEYIDQIADEARQNFEKYDVIKTENLPFGVNAFGYKRESLKKILELKEKSDSDTGWGEYFKDEENLSIKIINAKENHSNVNARMTLDYQEDLEFFKAIFNEIYHEDKYMTLDDILNLIRRNPKILMINKSAMDKYWENYNKKKGKRNI